MALHGLWKDRVEPLGWHLGPAGLATLSAGGLGDHQDDQQDRTKLLRDFLKKKKNVYLESYLKIHLLRKEAGGRCFPSVPPSGVVPLRHQPTPPPRLEPGSGRRPSPERCRDPAWETPLRCTARWGLPSCPAPRPSHSLWCLCTCAVLECRVTQVEPLTLTTVSVHSAGPHKCPPTLFSVF